jgi:hypothetical protein
MSDTAVGKKQHLIFDRDSGGKNSGRTPQESMNPMPILIPGQWTQAKIEVAESRARLHVNGAEQPTLIVNDLKQSYLNGAIALWVGRGSIAHFADLKVTP